MVYHHFKVGIFLVFLLANAAKIQQVQGDENNQTHLQPYLDEAGNLCQDKLETIQDTEYETMIQCRVAMKKTCTNQQIDNLEDNLEKQQHPNEACHTVYDKNCKTVYRPHRSKVRVRVCPDGNVNVANSPFETNTDDDDDNLEDNENNIVLDVRPNPRLPSPQIAKKCHKGRRTVCTTKYHTECTTQQVQQTMQEDHPKCQVEMVERCPAENEQRKCRRVPAMRCKIEKRTVVKTKPESKCSRVPRQFCRKEDCNKSDEEENLFNNDPNCYYRNQIVNEILPEEKCSLIPKQMCHPVVNGENTDSLRKKRSADNNNPLAMLRRHYLSRSTQNSQMLPRKSRNFNQKITTTSPPPQSTTKQVCKMSPEQVCEKKRVNPRVVEKKMMKRFCRQPKKNSYFDQYLVAKLRSRTTI